MDNTILFYATSYVAIRGAILIGIGYTIYQFVRRSSANGVPYDVRPRAVVKADTIRDDRC